MLGLGPSACAEAGPGKSAAARASLLLVAVTWGLNWPAAKFALNDLSPWTYRSIGLCGATLLMLAVARAGGGSLYIKRGVPRLHVAVAGLLNIAGFCLLSTFAQLGTTTSRAAICAYTMPLWAAALSRFVLDEHLDRWRGVALAVGACGLLVLLSPLAQTGVSVGILFALGSALCWAAGTVYLKWADIDAHPIAITTWQLAAGSVIVMLGMCVAGTHSGPVFTGKSAVAVTYNIFIGSALAYSLWFRSVARVPASTASLAILAVPAVGVAASMLLLGERPTPSDFAGLALILGAAACAVGPRPATNIDVAVFGRGGRRAGHRKLLAADESMLKDMGVSRCGIEWAVRHGRERDQAGEA